MKYLILRILIGIIFLYVPQQGLCSDGDNLRQGENVEILAAPAADHTSFGPTCDDVSAGEAVTIMDCVYLHSDGEWHKTDADAVATAEGMLAISLESKTDGQAMNVAFPGSFVRDDTWNWTIGGEIYLDTVTAGGLTQTAPSGTDNVVRIVGYATHADRIYLSPQISIIVHN